MNDRIYAYLAGVIDSDGCLLIHKRKMKNKYYYSPIFLLDQIDIKIVQILSNMYNRKINIIKRDNRKKIYRIILNGKNLINFLNKTLPYLILKKKQAELCLELQNNVNKESVYQQVCDLNQRKIKENQIKEIYNIKYKNYLDDLI